MYSTSHAHIRDNMHVSKTSEFKYTPSIIVSFINYEKMISTNISTGIYHAIILPPFSRHKIYFGTIIIQSKNITFAYNKQSFLLITMVGGLQKTFGNSRHGVDVLDNLIMSQWDEFYQRLVTRLHGLIPQFSY